MSQPVKFEKPPVVEVVFGVLFASQDMLKAAHVGAFWQQVKDKYPRTEDAPPVPTIVEEPPGAVEWDFLPPLRRTWLLSEDGRKLLQVQQDRFLFNWKRTLADDLYPSYEVNLAEFEAALAIFEDFLKSTGIPTPGYRQFELTYVNHITSQNGLDLVGIDGVLVDHIRNSQGPRFLPDAESFNWTTSYPLDKNYGRLHISAQVASVPESSKMVRLDITASGISDDISAEGRRRWFDLAHEWITHGFADVTAATLQQQAWGKKA
ncbi:TIGR04255 family protein [Duganella hordei]|jgi:uncharacterized protein (TIGR04255 family)|uniref:TIGR04255 family protein n=1 Tax=Duganella hordei TaxID=2865934 RepID=UPI0030E9A74A